MSRPYCANKKDYKYCDLQVGDVINELEIVELGEMREFDNGSKCGIVKCKCSKGHIFETISYYVKTGKVKECPECFSAIHLEEVWLYDIARDIYAKCYKNPISPIKCELGTSIKEIYDSILKIPGREYKGTFLYFVTPSKGYTLYNEKYGTSPWSCKDIRNNRVYKCLGNLRWIPLREQRQILTDISYEQMLTIPRSKITFDRICGIRGWNKDDFNLKWITYTDTRRGWLFLPKNEVIDKYKYPLRDLEDNSIVECD